MLPTSRFRLVLLCLVVVSVGLPMAWISLGKLILFVSCLVFLIHQGLQRRPLPELDTLWSVRVILFIIALFATSLLWSEATPGDAVQAFSKHGKLLEMVLLLCLIRSGREARIAALAFCASQTLFILSSWLMVAGWRVPWATSSLVPEYKYVVFSSYLDQTLIFAAAAAVLWHLRDLWPQPPWLRRTAATVAVAALVNILFFQEGRGGYVAALAVLTLALVWRIPAQWRLAVLVAAPLALGLLAYGTSARFQHRMSQVISESQNYRSQGDNASSSGFRIHAWRRSLQAMAEQPASGHGVGSWTLAVKRLEAASAVPVFGEGGGSNPHQEFLLWGVELGVGGILLLLLLLACLVRDALGFAAPVRHATLSVLAVMVVACLFNSALYDALIGDFFCITLGMLLALGVSGSAGRGQVS